MALRTFTVFTDTPTTDTHKPKASNNPAVLALTSSVLSNSIIQNNPTTVTTVEKENVHPVTGERAGPSNVGSKKRKTSVLATKLHTLESRGQKEVKESQPELKKRKSSSSSDKPKAVKKDSKTLSTSRKVKKPSRKVSPMPKLDEEAEVDKERERVTQAGINSRCYELTVRPLADVSQAYEQSGSIELISSVEDNVKFQPVKESSVEPEIRDYFSGPQSSCHPSGLTLPSPTEDFSTPDRKKIYSAFTFTSPSPTSERFSKATRAGIPRLELS